MRHSASDLNALYDFTSSDSQRSYVKAVIDEGSNRAAAKKLGVHPTAVDQAIRRVIVQATLRGWSPGHDMTHVVPDGFSVKGVSTYYDKDGKPRGQWVKSREDADRRNEMFLEAVGAIGESFKGMSKLVAPPASPAKDLITVYPMGDPHVGMYSYARETGNDFDCDIAERNIVAAVDRLVSVAPKTETALVLNVGDFFHADTSDNRTLRSGNALDVDTRWSRVMEIGIRAMRRCVDRALEKHKRVVVRNMIGNHDEHTSQALGIALKMFYENNKRVFVDTSPAYFWSHRFGKCLIGSTHGDTCKAENLPAIMADEWPREWGETTHRYWYTGHIHTKQVSEFRGCLVESFRTLAGRDAWHAKMGYRAGRDMVAIVLHKEFGEVERHRVDVGMLA